MKYSPAIQKLIGVFGRFPTVGPKTAARFAFHLLRSGKKETEALESALEDLKKKVKICSLCFKSFEGSSAEKLCEICSDKSRNRGLLCILENEIDLQALENTRKYRGLYFILGGLISSLKREDFQRIRNEELKARIKNHPEVKEIIIATDFTAEGRATALYLKRMLSSLKVKVTQLGQGLPVGGELEYADEETLSSALESRK